MARAGFGPERVEPSPDEIAYFYVYASHGYMCSLTELVKIAGARWELEGDFLGSKSTIGLNQTQVGLYRAWKRHVTASRLSWDELPHQIGPRLR